MSFIQYINESFNASESINILKSFESKYVEIDDIKLEGTSIQFSLSFAENAKQIFKKYTKYDYHSGDYYGQRQMKSINDFYKSNALSDIFENLENELGIHFPFNAKDIKIEKDSINKYTFEEGWYKWNRFSLNIGKKANIIINVKKIFETNSINKEKLKELNSSSEEITIDKKPKEIKNKKWFEAPFKKDELLEKGISEILVDFIIDKDLKSIKKMDDKFVEDFSKEIGVNDDFFCTVDTGSIYNCELLLKTLHPNNVIKVIDEFPKAWYSIRKVFNFKNKKYIDTNSTNRTVYDITVDSLTFGNKFIEYNEEKLKKLIINMNDISGQALKWFDRIRIKDYLTTEITFSLSTLESIENRQLKDESFKASDINYGIGNTRRDQMERLVKGGWIDEIKDGSSKKYFIPGLKKSNISNDKIIMDIAKKVKAKIPSESSNGYAFTRGVSVDGDKIIISIGYKSPSRSDRTEHGAPTDEYDTNVTNGLDELIDLAKELALKFDTNIVARQISIFDKMPGILVENNFREFLNNSK